jgi:hypothetical protein
MKCMKCNSPRIIKFLDGFGQSRVFCRTCHESILFTDFSQMKDVKKLSEFGAAH